MEQVGDNIAILRIYFVSAIRIDTGKYFIRRKDASEKQMIEVAKKANRHNFIMKLPKLTVQVL